MLVKVTDTKLKSLSVCYSNGDIFKLRKKPYGGEWSSLKMEPILWKEVGHLLFAHTRGPWKSVDKQKDLFHNYRGRELGNGGKTSFWNDSWIGRNSLEELYSGLYALFLKKNASISNLPLSNESSWNLSLILKDEILEWTSLSTLIEAFLSTVRDLAGYQKMVGFSLLNLLQKSWYLESWGLLMVFVHIFGGVPILKKSVLPAVIWESTIKMSLEEIPWIYSFGVN